MFTGSLEATHLSRRATQTVADGQAPRGKSMFQKGDNTSRGVTWTCQHPVHGRANTGATSKPGRGAPCTRFVIPPAEVNYSRASKDAGWLDHLQGIRKSEK